MTKIIRALSALLRRLGPRRAKRRDDDSIYPLF
ncbi:hypothetical protein BX285_4286 [Streptomyces sp. 1114.5]|nr:hypothetical protein BX285_4286 [Streptomyces sp. 1114.5]SOB86015.1 hypothetical protein SAMN06272789_6317 [Streptomyces sp. 1331.2]